ncbi:hypothetical protein [uncultured Treponema sp.]|uniref:hypothetical protein n=1 Tax=uncultured Treponema sp. TaxID=162155 RepID=UPI0025E69B52|nr:hypothetical protein [uncultured Treponema sp.]
MEKLNKKIGRIALVLGMVFFTAQNVPATGYPVFDVSGWLAAIDQVYQGYDMVMNTITQIENQYNMIQQQVERAKSIDWDNISFDGDFDIRNDIRDATKRVNRLLTSARNIKKMMTTPSISCGNIKYSIADLCGISPNNQDDLWENDKNLLTACRDYKQFMSETMQKTVSSLTDGLDEDQKKAIWVKYGISPQNYAFVQQSVNSVKKQCSEVMAAATEEAKRMKLEEIAMKNNTILQAALEGNLDSNGNPTEAGIAEAQLRLQDQLSQQLAELGFQFSDLCAITASKMIADQNKADAEQASSREAQETDYYRKKTISSRYKR